VVLVRWFLNKLAALINKWADREVERGLGQDIPPPSAPGPAEAPQMEHTACLCKLCRPELWKGWRPPEAVVRESIVTQDRPPELRHVWAGKSIEEICQELEGRA
jgi:hypothetical protein